MSDTSDALERLEQANAEYHEYADWFETNSVERAKKFITAIKRLINRAEQFTLAGTGGESARFNLVALRDEAREAMAFVGKRRATAGYMYGDLTYFRD